MSEDMLSVEQSAELIRRGVRPDAASMIRIDFGDSCAYVCGEQARTVMDCVKGKYLIDENQVFTFADVKDILPARVKHNRWINDYKLNIYWSDFSGYNVCYCCPNYKDIWYKSGGKLIDLLYDALIWALDNSLVSRQWLNK